MSRRKAQPETKPLLGPDGKPIDRAKYVKPKPTVAAISTVEETHSWTFEISDAVLPLSFVGKSFQFDTRSKTATAKRASLADRVAADVEALTADFEGAGGAELPSRPLDITEYHDALEHAMRNCKHTDIESTMYAKGEYQCQDCGHYLSREEMRKRRSGSIFGGWV